MSNPKNYRPIALLETLSKILEKVIMSRLIHEAGKFNLIPHAQFGGRNKTSCTDAGLCMVHDIRTCWAQNKLVSLLTLDVSGYFNNVDHNCLIYTLDWLGFSNEICNWMRSYLTNRTAQFHIDGILCPSIQLPTVGIPQGSPLSPILSSIYSIPLLLASQDPQAHSFAYINDFTILAYSNSYQNIITIIQDSITRINSVAKRLGLEFELPKSELIHFICPRSISKDDNPKLTISDSGTDTVIEPSACVRWLGFYLDRKLNFKEHIAAMAIRARAMVAGLRMLANSVRGLSVHHARILYKAAILPILSYCSPLWFHGHRQLSLSEPLRRIQNECLRWMLGAFKSTPIRPMEHLASIPPIHIHLQKINDNITSKIRTLPIRSEIGKRCPHHWDTHDPRHLAQPHTRPPSLTVESPIHRIATKSHPNAEYVPSYTVHPSQSEQIASHYPNQLLVNAKPHVELKVFIKDLKDHIDIIDRSEDVLVCYSDGHSSVNKGLRKVSVGYSIHWKKVQVSKFHRNLGPRANIYDAEMLGIATCLSKAVQIAKNENINTIYVFCDNQSAIDQISSLKPHPAHYASRVFTNAVHTFLKDQTDHNIRVGWIPGHKGFAGNELADKLAKKGSNVPPTPVFNRTITWMKTRASLTASHTWTRTWNAHIAKRPDSHRFIPRPPSMKLHPIFNKNTLTRSISSRLVQLLTTHGWYGEYGDRFHKDWPTQCYCGESIQTIIHTLLFCPSTEGQRHILRECSKDLDEQELFGTLTGLEAVSKFIAKTGIGKPRRTSGNRSRSVSPYGT